MSTLFAILGVCSFFAVPVLFVILVIKAIRKKPVKKTAMGMLGCFIACIVLVVLSSLDVPMNCEHEFVESESIAATCTSEGRVVQTCTKCEKVTEESVPMVSHDFTEATCKAPATCKVCGAVEGTTTDHTPGKMKVVDTVTMEQKCTECKIVLKTETFDSPSELVKFVIEDVVDDYSAEIDAECIEDDDNIVITAALYCENDETVVKDIASAIAKKLKKIDIKTDSIILVGDIEDGKDGEPLAMVSIGADGKYEITSMSVNFNTERNIWLKNQFSAWDGSHNVLTELILDNLNDEKSYKHIETTYVDVSTSEKKQEVNNILKQAGYSQRVEIDDLFVMTQFSAKNAFNATVKNTAFGIVDYSENLVTLIAIE